MKSADRISSDNFTFTFARFFAGFYYCAQKKSDLRM